MSLSINNLAFSRNNEILFHDIDCKLTSGEILQVRGANGSGKSTLLRIIAGLITPESGSVQWMGKNISQQDDYLQQISYLSHQNGIKPYLTVYENLKLHCALTGKKSSSENLIHVLEKSGLRETQHTPAIHLSAGQARRLALSRLFLTDARLWILDEPTTSLDRAGQTFLINLLNQHLSQGKMAIVATHDDLTTLLPAHTLSLDRSHV